MRIMTGLCAAGLCTLLFVGCDNRSEELQQQIVACKQRETACAVRSLSATHILKKC